MTRPAQPPAGSSGAFDAVSQLADACASAIGPAGVIARALVGITLIALALLWRDPDSQDAALGLQLGVFGGVLLERTR